MHLKECSIIIRYDFSFQKNSSCFFLTIICSISETVSERNNPVHHLLTFQTFLFLLMNSPLKCLIKEMCSRNKCTLPFAKPLEQLVIFTFFFSCTKISPGLSLNTCILPYGHVMLAGRVAILGAVQLLSLASELQTLHKRSNNVL